MRRSFVRLGSWYTTDNMANNKRIYLDYAAASPLRPEAEEAMHPFLSARFANPSALYHEADATREALAHARGKIAGALHVRPFEVVFTSGSTESNNLAIAGYREAQEKPGTIISTNIEHSSIAGPLNACKRKGWEVTYAPVDEDGRIDMEAFEALLAGGAHLVTLAWANPDIGVVQDISTIGRLCKKHDTVLHIDASQAAGLLSLATAGEAADMCTLSSAKAYGPRGVGALTVRSAVSLAPVLRGGGQERALRPGTENVAGAVGFGVAIELADKEREGEAARLAPLRDLCIKSMLRVDGVVLTGPTKERLANHASFAIKNADGEELVVRLDALGFAVGTGSACATGEDQVSEAVKATGVSPEYHAGTLRVTLGKETTQRDIEAFVSSCADVITKMQQFNGKE